jgi:hypothetical protein
MENWLTISASMAISRIASIALAWPNYHQNRLHDGQWMALLLSAAV